MKFRVPGIILGILLLGALFCFGHGDEEVAEDQVIEKRKGEIHGILNPRIPLCTKLRDGTDAIRSVPSI